MANDEQQISWALPNTTTITWNTFAKRDKEESMWENKAACDWLVCHTFVYWNVFQKRVRRPTTRAVRNTMPIECRVLDRRHHNAPVLRADPHSASTDTPNRIVVTWNRRAASQSARAATPPIEAICAPVHTHVIQNLLECISIYRIIIMTSLTIEIVFRPMNTARYAC